MNRKTLVLLFVCIISFISNMCLGLSDEEYERLPIRTKQICSSLLINYKEIKPIYTLDDLQGIDDLNKNYLLMNDIDAASTQERSFRTLSGRFNGYFIGQGFSILNLNTTKSERVYKTVSHGYLTFGERYGIYGNYKGVGYCVYETSKKVLDYMRPFIFDKLRDDNNIISLNINAPELKYTCCCII